MLKGLFGSVSLQEVVEDPRTVQRYVTASEHRKEMKRKAQKGDAEAAKQLEESSARRKRRSVSIQQ